MSAAKETKTSKGLKLDIGCGRRCAPGFDGVDAAELEGVVHRVDLFQYPWPFEDGSVAEIYSNNFVEHIPHYRPEYDGQDGWWMFFGELYRICRPDAKLTIVHPYAMNARADWDPTHERRIHEVTWYYLSREWRANQQIDHYGADVDFEVITITALGVNDAVMLRNEAAQTFSRTHYWNVVSDLQVDLRCRK